MIRTGRVSYRGRVCQSDRSWLGRAISWLSFRFAFRNESRMYSSGSIAALGIVAFEVACTGMLCTPFGIHVHVRETLCGLHTYSYVHTKLRYSVAPSWLHIRDTCTVCERLGFRKPRKGFKGAISRYFRGIDTIFFQIHLKYHISIINAISFTHANYSSLSLYTLLYMYNCSLNNL